MYKNIGKTLRVTGWISLIVGIIFSIIKIIETVNTLSSLSGYYGMDYYSSYHWSFNEILSLISGIVTVLLIVALSISIPLVIYAFGKRIEQAEDGNAQLEKIVANTAARPAQVRAATDFVAPIGQDKSWKCASCGKDNNGDFDFCVFCGGKR